MNSSQIKLALANKHSDDFFACEVTIGSGQNNAGRIDAFAMKKSWVKPLTIIYEIKISRSDFINDNKWMQYLPYCNQFYFVCPYNLIDQSEIPQESGLMYVSDTKTKRVRTVKKSPYRTIEPKDEATIYKRILMSKLKSDRHPFHSDVKEFWKAWLENKKYNKNFGYIVKTELAREYFQLQKRQENSARFEQIVREKFDRLGLTMWNFDQEIKTLREGSDIGVVSNSMKRNLNIVKERINSMLKTLEN